MLNKIKSGLDRIDVSDGAWILGFLLLSLGSLFHLWQSCIYIAFAWGISVSAFIMGILGLLVAVCVAIFGFAMAYTIATDMLKSFAWAFKYGRSK